MTSTDNSLENTAERPNGLVWENRTPEFVIDRNVPTFSSADPKPSWGAPGQYAISPETRTADGSSAKPLEAAIPEQFMMPSQLQTTSFASGVTADAPVLPTMDSGMFQDGTVTAQHGVPTQLTSPGNVAVSRDQATMDSGVFQNGTVTAQHGIPTQLTSPGNVAVSRDQATMDSGMFQGGTAAAQHSAEAQRIASGNVAVSRDTPTSGSYMTQEFTSTSTSTSNRDQASTPASSPAQSVSQGGQAGFFRAEATGQPEFFTDAAGTAASPSTSAPPVSAQNVMPVRDPLMNRASDPSRGQRDVQLDSDSRRFISYQEKKAEAEFKYRREMEEYESQIKRLRSRVWIVVAAVIGITLLSFLIGAMLGSAAMQLYFLFVALGITVMAVTGKLKWMRVPRKPRQEMFELMKPDMEEIHSVRIRLVSINMPSPIEIVIRKARQVIGRDKKLCYQPLELKGISRQHFEISCKTKYGHSEYLVMDLGSKNGTRLNGKDLQAHQPYQLKIGDTITISRLYEFKVSSDAI